MTEPAAIILAAGKSTRMNSALPKVIHEVCGRPMIECVLDAARGAGAQRIVVVVGHEAERVQATLAHHRDLEFVHQTEQKGTGHAVSMAGPALADHDGPVLILAGDTPLLRAESLQGLLDQHQKHAAACVIGTAVTAANEGLGRVVRGAGGEFLRIVEQKDATPEEAALQEINTGCYAFDSRLLFDALARVRPNNKQGELYLTDAPAILKADGRTIVASRQFDIVEAMGVNTRVQLADVERTIRTRGLERLMLAGVTLVSPEQTSIDPRATIGRDTVIHPFTVISGPAVIGERCRIGPHAVIEGAVTVPAGATVTPFSHIVK